MHIGAQPDVVGEIPAHMVGVVVDHDSVAVPVPAIAVAIVVVGDVEVVAVEPEPLSRSAAQYPNMAWAKATVEPPVLPRMFHTIVSILAATVMANPSAIIVDMRCVGMSFMVAKARLFRSSGYLVMEMTEEWWSKSCNNYSFLH